MNYLRIYNKFRAFSLLSGLIPIYWQGSMAGFNFFKLDPERVASVQKWPMGDEMAMAVLLLAHLGGSVPHLASIYYDSDEIGRTAALMDTAVMVCLGISYRHHGLGVIAQFAAGASITLLVALLCPGDRRVKKTH